jgi:hypothetical protein
MSKELKTNPILIAQQLREEYANHLIELGNLTQANGTFWENGMRAIDRAFDEVIKALTPPTAEEICEAIGKHYKLVHYESCLFDVNTKNIVVNRWAEKIHIVWFYEGEILIIEYLPLNLITLIGRFYEGIDNNVNTK